MLGCQYREALGPPGPSPHLLLLPEPDAGQAAAQAPGSTGNQPAGRGRTAVSHFDNPVVEGFEIGKEGLLSGVALGLLAGRTSPST